MSRILGGAASVDDGGDPPNWCLRPGPDGQPATCSFYGGEWHRSYDEGGLGSPGDGAPAGFAVFFVLAVVLGIAGTAWKVSTARRMARDAGMDEGDATAMTLLTDDGFESTYLASSLRGSRPAEPPSEPAPSRPSASERLRQLQALLDEGLISQDEHDTRRRAILDEL